VKLGTITFQDFEIPSNITFGGKQVTAAHRLCGGRRVVDVLGPDNADISLSGAFSGADALPRAHSLDLLRKSGAAVVLSWDSFCCTVVVTRFLATYQNPVWIPYNAICTIVQDDSGSISSGFSGEHDSLAPSMLATAGALIQSLPSLSALSIQLGLPDDGLANRPQAIVEANERSRAQDDIATRLMQTELQVTVTAVSQGSSPLSIVANLATAESTAQTMSELVYIRSYLAAATPSTGGMPYA
jgi:hypothetical protein